MSWRRRNIFVSACRNVSICVSETWSKHIDIHTTHRTPYHAKHTTDIWKGVLNWISVTIWVKTLDIFLHFFLFFFLSPFFGMFVFLHCHLGSEQHHAVARLGIFVFVGGRIVALLVHVDVKNELWCNHKHPYSESPVITTKFLSCMSCLLLRTEFAIYC